MRDETKDLLNPDPHMDETAPVLAAYKLELLISSGQFHVLTFGEILSETHYVLASGNLFDASLLLFIQ